jgi:hypothetical protein
MVLPTVASQMVAQPEALLAVLEPMVPYLVAIMTAIMVENVVAIMVAIMVEDVVAIMVEIMVEIMTEIK